jgi:hypothetical protein
MKWAIFAGNFEKGFDVTGPFDSEQDAEEYAEDAIRRYSTNLDVCKVIKLEPPGE